MTVGVHEIITGTALSVEVDNGIAIVTLDVPGASVNTLGRAVVEEFSDLFDRVEKDLGIRALVLTSGKPEGFIAGADIEQLVELRSAREAELMSRAGQAMMDRVERLRAPVVAAIHGACLGGGLETVLACAYRIGTDHPRTVLAAPEVMLGLIPGAGGTQRLPRRIGLRAALDMILTGKNVRAKKALQLGLLDEMVHPSILRDVAVDRARQLAYGGIERERGRVHAGVSNAVFEGNLLGRGVVFRKAREGVMEKTHGHMPAPLAALDAVRAGYEMGRERGFAEEARLFGEMAMTPESKQLIFLFFATTALKKDSGTDLPTEPLPVNKLGILGAGFMGSGIASVAAMQGTVVRLKDADHARVAKGLKAVSEVLRERLKKKQITRRQFDDQMTLVGGTVEYAGFGSVDLVIEAVFEDLTLKHKVLQEAEQVIPGDAIYASNTSTIPITRIAEVSQRPEQVLGMHFFSPVPRMPLLEVIVTERTVPTATATAVAYGKKLGKHVIVVNDGPGFYTTRTLAAFLNEAGYLLDQGVTIEALDRALVDFGFPVGPITLMDEVGLDVGEKVGKVLFDAFGARLAPSQSLARVAASGRAGRKGGKGFYQYDGPGGKKGAVDESVYQLLPTGVSRMDIPVGELQDRCVLAMVNEAAHSLEEGVLRSPRDGDVGAVFGIGFPPFRGGPFRYIDAIGAATILRGLEEFHGRFAPRFEPAGVIVDMAKSGAKFYADGGKGELG
ncbi:MAG TPA: fatty acid oxidation complex subunit alpha FadJ [Gemmatimonadaceae bacterium]|nr:fatty acid oxidation complex subunit alpha FadJ [Gemmatimonadaceae bacterium]